MKIKKQSYKKLFKKWTNHNLPVVFPSVVGGPKVVCF